MLQNWGFGISEDPLNKIRMTISRKDIATTKHPPGLIEDAPQICKKTNKLLNQRIKEAHVSIDRATLDSLDDYD